MSKNSGGVRKTKFQASRNQSHERCARKDMQALGAFLSFYLETVLKPFWGSTLRIMTGILRALQAVLEKRVEPSRKNTGFGPMGASLSTRPVQGLRPVVGQ